MRLQDCGPGLASDERAFSHAGLAAWNRLPETVRTPRDLKTFLFNALL